MSFFFNLVTIIFVSLSCYIYFDAKSIESNNGFDSCSSVAKKSKETVIFRLTPLVSPKQSLNGKLPFAFEYFKECKQANDIFLVYKIVNDIDREKKIKKHCDRILKEKSKLPPSLFELCDRRNIR